MGDDSFIKNLFLKIIESAIVSFVLTILPPLMAVLTVYLGSATYNWFQVALGGLAAFAFTGIGLLCFYQLIYLLQIKDKISFQAAGVALNVTGINTYCIRIEFTNHDRVPIDFEVQEIHTSLDLITTAPNPLSKRFTIPPNGFGWYADNPIQLRDAPISRNVQGRVEFTIKYGRSGTLKHTIKGKKEVHALFNEKGELVGSIWNDARD